MDLILVKDKHPVKYLDSYTLDMEYGTRSTNDFVLTLPLGSENIRPTDVIYGVDTSLGSTDPTQVGGMVTRIGVNTQTKTAEYYGLTAPGLLNKSKVYSRTLSGDAAAELARIIQEEKLQSIFAVYPETSDFVITYHQMDRVGIYDGFAEALAEIGAKLKWEWSGGICRLFIDPVTNYSTDAESQADVMLSSDFLPVNHVMCVSDDGYKIDLYADAETGEPVQYASVDKPYKDSQYFTHNYHDAKGPSDNCEIVECGTVGDGKQNYELLTTPPFNWPVNCQDYFIRSADENGNVSYKQAETGVELTYSNPLTSKPVIWETGYWNYYERSAFPDQTGAYTYTQVSGDPVYSYVLMKEDDKPADWEYSYKDYYYKRNDGVHGNEYLSVEPKRVDTDYRKCKKKPTDFDRNFRSYYCHRHVTVERSYTNPSNKSKAQQKKEAIAKLKASKPDFVLVKTEDMTKSDSKYGRFRIVYKLSKTYSSCESKEDWSKYKGYIYVKETTDVPAKWKANTYYRQVQTGEQAPHWRSGVFCEGRTSITFPPFKDVYQKVSDHYEGMVQKGKELLKKAWDGKDIIQTDAYNGDVDRYDIGDICGRTDQYTGLSIYLPVTRKVVTINKKFRKHAVFMIDYQIGEQG